MVQGRTGTGAGARWAVLLVVGAAALALMGAALRAPSGSSAAAEPGAPVQQSASRVAALFVGDSYTAGQGASTPALAWPCQAARTLDWICNRDAQGGTGFLNAGTANTATFSPVGDRLAATADRYLADVVVVDAGRNDMSYPADEVLAAAGDYVVRVREQWPEAVLVLVVPSFLTQTADDADAWHRAVADGMAALAATHDALVLDPLVERTSRTDVGRLLDADGIHPDDAGHTLLAEGFVAAVRAAGLASPPLTDQAVARR